MWIGTTAVQIACCGRITVRPALPALFQILIRPISCRQSNACSRTSMSMTRSFRRELWPFHQCALEEQGIRAAQAEVHDDYTRRRVELYAEYETQCQREGVADFAELLLRTYELLVRNEPLRQHYQQRFRHILVDEFQDTNVLQYKWLKLLAGYGDEQGAKLFAVGRR